MDRRFNELLDRLPMKDDNVTTRTAEENTPEKNHDEGITIPLPHSDQIEVHDEKSTREKRLRYIKMKRSSKATRDEMKSQEGRETQSQKTASSDYMSDVLGELRRLRQDLKRNKAEVF